MVIILISYIMLRGATDTRSCKWERMVKVKGQRDGERKFNMQELI